MCQICLYRCLGSAGQKEGEGTQGRRVLLTPVNNTSQSCADGRRAVWGAKPADVYNSKAGKKCDHKASSQLWVEPWKEVPLVFATLRSVVLNWEQASQPLGPSTKQMRCRSTRFVYSAIPLYKGLGHTMSTKCEQLLQRENQTVM